VKSVDLIGFPLCRRARAVGLSRARAGCGGRAVGAERGGDRPGVSRAEPADDRATLRADPMHPPTANGGPTRLSRRPQNLTEFVPEECQARSIAVPEHLLAEGEPVKSENAAALTELLGVSVGMVEAIHQR
jgi:hypothetical protein